MLVENEIQLETLKGHVVKMLYDSDGYQAFAMKTPQGHKTKTVCISNFPYGTIKEHENYSFVGNYSFSEKYGREQFDIACIKSDIPIDEEGIRDYLTKHINGIGSVTAQKIVDTFGLDTWNVIETTPEKLCEIKGISLSKAQKIFSDYLVKIGSRDDIIWFNKHHIVNFNYILKIKQAFRDYKIKIEENPYILVTYIDGIGFKKADDIASTFGFEGDNPFRIAAGIKQILENAQNYGHVFLTHDELLTGTSQLLSLSKDSIQKILNRLLESDTDIRENDPVCFIKLINDNGAIYEERMYKEENNIAAFIQFLSNNSKNIEQVDKNFAFNKIDEIAKATHKDKNFQLDISQKEAILNSVNNSVSVITGGPGTGKTTTLNTIIAFLDQVMGQHSFTLLAPTGKAAKRMSEQTGKEATTIHKAVGFGTDKKQQIFSETIIIDEMSMADMHIINRLFNSIIGCTRLIFVGDIDQLPSIGCGNILKDIIDSHTVPVSKLNVIHRQAEKSGIIRYSHGIIEEHMFPENPNVDDFIYINCENADLVEEQVIEMYLNGIPQFLEEQGLDPNSVQILTPLKKENFKLSSGSFNSIIQKKHSNALTPSVTFFKTTTYFLGDKVIHIKNDYNLLRQNINTEKISKGVMNGESGTIVEIDDKRKTLTVQYEDDLVVYSKENISEISLAYALTVHKSQGSEYQAVIIPIVNGGMASIMNKNLLYTAVTRAKKLCIVIGSKATISRMVHTKFSEKRNTKLAYRLQTLYKGVE